MRVSLDAGLFVQVLTFNSLSRDHWRSHELELPHSTAMARRFQLPLSGSPDEEARNLFKLPIPLSTPSLGITTIGAMIGEEPLEKPTFNSLSRDHGQDMRSLRRLQERMSAFNSLSRDH